MKIAPNIEMLEIKGERGTLYPVLLWDDAELVLIDTALPGQTDALREAVEKTGHSLGDITKVILTHQDLDHVGSAKALSGLGAKILAHKLDAPYIEGEITSIRLTDMESRLAELSEEERAFYERAKKGAPYFFVRVDQPLQDSDVLSYCGGIEVLHTPGHTPGHIALLLRESNILVAGDGANILDGQLFGSNPDFTKNMEEAQVSFEKMLAKKPASIICYHGGLYTTQANAGVANAH